MSQPAKLETCIIYSVINIQSRKNWVLHNRGLLKKCNFILTLLAMLVICFIRKYPGEENKLVFTVTVVVKGFYSTNVQRVKNRNYSTFMYIWCLYLLLFSFYLLVCFKFVFSIWAMHFWFLTWVFYTRLNKSIVSLVMSIKLCENNRYHVYARFQNI